VGKRGKPARGRRRRRNEASARSLLRELPLLVVVALVLALGIKTFLVQAFYIPSGSMENTARIGDRVLVDKFSPWFGAKPERGEIVVFKDPGGWLGHKPAADPPPVLKQLKQAGVFVGLLPSDDDQDLIKRVIGVGGDTVACCDSAGRVTVNGAALDEPYIFPGDDPSTQRFSVQVPKGRLWVMGDHRGDSGDSRAHMDKAGGGTVAEEDVVGRAVLVGWPLGRIHRLPVPGTFSHVPDKPQGNSQGNSQGDVNSSESEENQPTVATPAGFSFVMPAVSAVPAVALLRRVRSRRGSPGGWKL
jgi:signal peptidase I